MAEESVETLKAKVADLEDRVKALEKAVEDMPSKVAKRQSNLAV